MTDLDEIRRCNEQLKELISEEVDERSLMKILDERRGMMSRRRESRVEREIQADVIVSRSGDVMLGFPVEFVKEVHKNYAIPLAHGTDIVVGLYQSRGQVCTLVDILPLLGRTAAGRSALGSGFIVLLSCETREIGVLVDELIGRRIIYQDEIARGHDEEKSGIVASISKDLVSIIDTKALFASPQIVLGHGGQ